MLASAVAMASMTWKKVTGSVSSPPTRARQHQAEQLCLVQRVQNRLPATGVRVRSRQRARRCAVRASAPDPRCRAGFSPVCSSAASGSVRPEGDCVAAALQDFRSRQRSIGALLSRFGFPRIPADRATACDSILSLAGQAGVVLRLGAGAEAKARADEPRRQAYSRQSEGALASCKSSVCIRSPTMWTPSRMHASSCCNAGSRPRWVFVRRSAVKPWHGRIAPAVDRARQQG